MANAFASVSHVALDSVIDDALDWESARVVKHRHRWAMTSLGSHAGEWALSGLGRGDLQGGAAAQSRFTCVHDPRIQTWIEAAEEEGWLVSFRSASPSQVSQ
eukprot:4628100-Pyramimonas_sp.AAC.1